MHENKMIIGSHTVNHPVMSRLCLDDQLYQIRYSFEYLESIIGKNYHKTFCFPLADFIHLRILKQS